MNEDRTCANPSTPRAQKGSGPVRVEVIDRFGQMHGPFKCLVDAAAYVKRMWPDQEQDEDRAGRGWDVQVVGS